jgi:anaerobic ribonucleoside-triphosphate reductase activating protein
MLRIGKILTSEGVNGPGKRLVIWFQGCPFRCRGCFNPEFWDEEGGQLFGVVELANIILNTQDIEGVTFTGGEPLIQAKEILPLAQIIKSKGLSIVCYTGYLMEDILHGRVPYGKELLKFIDILIDGLYIEEERAALLWRGSRNQRVFFLTDRYKEFEPLASKEGITEAEFKIGEEGVFLTGIFDMEFWKKIKERINKNR